jgi:hypothetical protein
MRKVLFISALLIAFNPLAQAFDCMEIFDLTMKGKNYEDKKKIFKKLNKKEMQCLYKKASERGDKPNIDWIIGPDFRDGMTVAKFYGRNSLPFFRSFQKHFLVKESKEGAKLIGYNYQGFLSRITGPGFFTVYNDEKGELIFDYRGDIRKTLTRGDLEMWDGVMVRKIKSNKGSVYNGLRDIVYKINEDFIIGEAYKISKRKKKRKILSIFMLLRIP